MTVPAGAATPWQSVFASAGAQTEHEQRAVRILEWIRRIVRGHRSPAADRETLIALHRNRETARHLERERSGDLLRLGWPSLR